MINTANLGDSDQRQQPIEQIAVVIGTAGTPPYIHLQLEMMRVLFGTTMPALIVNDGPMDSRLFDVVRKYPFAELMDFEKPLGHTVGDMRVFKAGFEWAERIGAGILVKFSRRFIPLISWRHGLQVLVSENQNVAAFTRRHNDRADGLFRTDAIALRVSKFNNEKTKSIIDESMGRNWINVEPMFESFARMNGGWALWDLLGPDFYRPYHKATQWRGLLPYHYGDLSRMLGLPYGDMDFANGTYTTETVKGFLKSDVANVVEVMK